MPINDYSTIVAGPGGFTTLQVTNVAAGCAPVALQSPIPLGCSCTWTWWYGAALSEPARQHSFSCRVHNPQPQACPTCGRAWGDGPC